MTGTQNAGIFTFLAILLVSPLALALALSQRESTGSGRDSIENLVDWQPFCWFSVVLDQYNASPEAMDVRKTEMVADWHACPQRQSEVNYSDPLTQAAYIRGQPALYVNVLAQIIDESPILKALFNRPLLNVVAVGTGPGTEMAGVINYVLNHHHRSKIPAPPGLRFLLTDNSDSWRLAIDYLENAIKGTSTGSPLFFEKTFFQWNVQGQNQNEGRPALHLHPTVVNGDLFIFQFVYSVILCASQNGSSSEIETATENLRQLVSSAPDGALFLFVDAPGRREEILRFLEPAIFSPINSTKLADKPQMVFGLPWNRQIEACMGKHYTKNTNRNMHCHNFYVLYKKTQKAIPKYNEPNVF